MNLSVEDGFIYKRLLYNLSIFRWGKLDIVSGSEQHSYSDQTIMFAAGYLEGALTAK